MTAFSAFIDAALGRSVYGFTPPHVQTAAVEAHTEQVHSVAETDPMTSLLSGSGLDHICCEHVDSAERECSRLRAELMLAEGSLTSFAGWGP